jgi:hypothetical protein
VLAGEWITGSLQGWPSIIGRQTYQAHFRSELYGPAMAGGVFSGDPLEFWERDAAMRERVRPLFADKTKSDQFLAAKQLVMDAASCDMFLDDVTRDFFAALNFSPGALVAIMDQTSRWSSSPIRRNRGLEPHPFSLFERWIIRHSTLSLTHSSPLARAHQVQLVHFWFGRRRRCISGQADGSLRRGAAGCRTS